MQRLRLIDFRSSRGPTLLGICQGDVAQCAQYVNAAQERLLLSDESKDESWWGTWTAMAFNVGRDDPFITLPREVARLEKITICNRPVRIQNQFYEFLDFGIGYQKPTQCCQFLETYERGVFPTFKDWISGYKLRVYITDDADIGKRVLVQGTDTSDNTIYSQDGLASVTGEYLDLTSPFVETDALDSLDGLQKDITIGVVRFYMVHPTTGEQTLILTMEPSEKTAAYRRYQFTGLPKNCCDPLGPGTTVQVQALAKLEFIPVRVDTDYLLIQHMEAVIKECQCIRYESHDSATSAQLAIKHHREAIALLNGQLNHYLGTSRPAVIVAPFGSARLARQGIGAQYMI